MHKETRGDSGEGFKKQQGKQSAGDSVGREDKGNNCCWKNQGHFGICRSFLIKAFAGTKLQKAVDDQAVQAQQGGHELWMLRLM